jgi:predicted nucleic acid-binding protein
VILLLDTTVLIDVLRVRLERGSLLAAMVREGHVLATTAMNLAEVYVGVKSSEEQRTGLFFAELEIYPMTATIAQRAGELKRDWAKKGKTLGLPDTIIAATALEHDLTLMTDNRKDFPMPELRLFDLP